MLKLGDVEWMSLPIRVTGMDATDVLRAAATDAAFAAALTDVHLTECAVHVPRQVAGEEPTPTEAAATEQLRGAYTLQDLPTVKPTAGRVWVRLQLPGTGMSQTVAATRIA